MKSITQILMMVVVLGTECIMGNEDKHSGEEPIKERVTVRKSPNDKRSFRGLKLSNEMKVLLIRDPSAEKALVSLAVGVGGINDYQKLEGLTNLIGGILLGGSKNYCRPFNFIKFLSDNGGSIDLPDTKTHDQVFTFDVNPLRLAHALERFADIFSHPLLTSSAAHWTGEIMDRAARFLQLEFEQRAKLDQFRIQQVEKEICRPKHAYCKLICGNTLTLLQTLEHINTSPTMGLYKRAGEFLSFWYSSNIMTLAVLGKENLDELEKMVVPQFNEVVNKNRTKLVFPFRLHPWGPDQLGYKIFIMPLENTEELSLKFPVPDVHESYKTAPELYLIDLIDSRKQNCLDSLLQNKNLCSSLNTEYTFEAGIAFLKISCTLTDAARATDLDGIINLIFQYIQLIRDEGVTEWMFNSWKFLREQLFLKQKANNETVPSFISNLAYRMQYYPTEDILSNGYIIEKWDQKLVEDFLRYLKPNNMNVIIVSKTFWDNTVPYQQEKYFGTNYRIEQIPKDVMEKWSTREHIPNLQLPLWNEFIPEDMSLYPPDLDEQKHGHPYLLHESPIMEIWYKQDDQFNVAELYVTFELYSPTFRLSPINSILLNIFHQLLISSLEEYLYPAELAGYDWKLMVENHRLIIMLYGYSDKLTLLLRRFLSQMMDLKNEINEEMFESGLKQYLQQLKKLALEDISFLIKLDVTRHILSDLWPMESFFNVGNTLKYKDMRKFLSKMFRRISIRGLIHGNCNKEKAIDIFRTIEEYFQSSNGLLLHEFLPSRFLEVARGNFVYETSNVITEMYAYNALYQMDTDPTNLAKNVASLVLKYAVDVECEKQILFDVPSITPPRVVCTLFSIFKTHYAFLIGVLSEKEPHFIDRRVESFMNNMANLLWSMSDSELKRVKETIEEVEMNSSNLIQVSKHYFREILNMSYHFDRVKNEVELLHSMQMHEFVAFFKETLDNSSPKRRKMAVYVYNSRDIQTRRSTSLSFVNSRGEKMENTRIKDLAEFIASSSLHPNLYYPAPAHPV